MCFFKDFYFEVLIKISLFFKNIKLNLKKVKKILIKKIKLNLIEIVKKRLKLAKRDDSKKPNKKGGLYKTLNKI